MDELVLISAPDSLRTLVGLGGLPLLSIDEMESHAPDEHWVLIRDNSEISAQCSVWWSSVPVSPGEKLGVIGHYSAGNEEGSSKLLQHVCEKLAQQGCTLAVGPMDGNTWRRYRLLTERGSEPVFFLEPDNPDAWPSFFEAAGFSNLAGYSSALNNDLGRTDDRARAVDRRMEDIGVVIRNFDPRVSMDELRKIYSVCIRSFNSNFLYSPISKKEFFTIYEGALPFIIPGIAQIAEREGTPVGFLFALPDMLQPKRGDPVDTIIIKTLAVVPGREYSGLGLLLMERVHAAARDLGYRRAINALMYDGNNSRNISRRYAVPFRKYTLYCRRL